MSGLDIVARGRTAATRLAGLNDAWANTRGIPRKIAASLPPALSRPRVMASPPTTTLSSAATIASPRIYTFGAVKPFEGVTFFPGISWATISGAANPQSKGSVYPDYNYTVFKSVNYGDQFSCNYVCLSFIHRGSAIELDVKGTNGGALMMKVDGEYIAFPTAQALTNADGLKYWYVDFGSVATRRIELFATGYLPLGGLRVAATDTVVPAALRGPRVALMGDSFAEGSVADAGALTNYQRTLFAALGWEDVILSGVGTTGFLGSQAPKPTYRSRFATDIAPYSPEVVIFQGSVNDTSSSVSALATEAATLFAQARTTLPNALLICTAPLMNKGAGGLPATVWAQKDALKAAILAVGGIFLDPLELPLAVAPVSTTLAAAASAGATTISLTAYVPAETTLKFADGTRCLVRSVTGSSAAGPWTATIDYLAAAQASGTAVVSVGRSLWTGLGRVGAAAGFGNCDLLVSSDTTHPTQAGHDAIGETLAQLLHDALTAG